MERDKNCHWGDFGGSAKTGEDLLDTTTREGAEELNGFSVQSVTLKSIF